MSGVPNSDPNLSAKSANLSCAPNFMHLGSSSPQWSGKTEFPILAVGSTPHLGLGSSWTRSSRAALPNEEICPDHLAWGGSLGEFEKAGDSPLPNQHLVTSDRNPTMRRLLGASQCPKKEVWFPGRHDTPNRWRFAFLKVGSWWFINHMFLRTIVSIPMLLNQLNPHFSWLMALSQNFRSKSGQSSDLVTGRRPKPEHSLPGV